ncbi:MAG: prolyl-tRNA synthetase associated domain-containing protein [Lachnospiraceae bacterium]
MNEAIHDTTLYKGAPSPEGRLPKEMAVYELLDRLEIPYERLDHDAMMTIEACQDVDKLLGISICKNLFLCNSQKTKFYLLLMPGEKRFDTKTFCKQIGSPRLSFAPAEYMEEFLNITPGSVSVLGLMNDKDRRVSLYIDEEVLAAEEFGCHPCINTSSLKLKTADIINKFLPCTGHGYETVRL